MTRRARWLRLAHRLGPWSNPRVLPGSLLRSLQSTATGSRGELALRVVEPGYGQPVTGAILVLHGVHHLGPDDPRLDRFLHVLAEFGFVVMAPYLPDYLALVPQPEVERDAEAALRSLMEHPRLPVGIAPGVFSISFGSFPALRLVAGALQDNIGAAVCFGGFADWQESMRFAVRGAPGRPPDIRNHPVVYLNLMDHVEGAPKDGSKRRALADIIRTLVRMTWGDDTVPTREEFRRVTEKLAASAPAELGDALHDAAGVSEDGTMRVELALERASQSLVWLDPRSDSLRGSTVPLTIVHGRDDTVIPVEEADRLERATPTGTRVFRTGLYRHADPEAPGSLLGTARELATLGRVLKAIVEAGVGSRR